MEIQKPPQILLSARNKKSKAKQNFRALKIF